MINVLISGATGAMGKTLIDLIRNNDNFNISAGFAEEYEKLEDFTIYRDIEKSKKNLMYNRFFIQI